MFDVGAHPGGPALELARRVVVAGDALSCVDGRLIRHGVAADEPYAPVGTVDVVGRAILG